MLNSNAVGSDDEKVDNQMLFTWIAQQ
jgi:hypothetical protein